MCVFIPLVDLCPLPKQTPLWDQSLRALYHLNPPGPCATPLQFNKGALKHLTVTLTPSFWAPGDEANLEPGLGRANMSSLLLPCQPSCPPHTHTHTHTQTHDLHAPLPLSFTISRWKHTGAWTTWSQVVVIFKCSPGVGEKKYEYYFYTFHTSVQHSSLV